MNFVLFLLVITVLAFVIYAETHEVRGRIFNGEDVDIGQFKFMAFLVAEEAVCCRLIKAINICAGAIIAPNWVLTAAHCLHKTDRATVFLGANVAGDAKLGYKVTHSSYVFHPQYRKKGSYNDIAMIQIPKTVECDEIAYARLPFFTGSTATETFAGKTAVIMGWGAKGNGGNPTDRLQMAKVPVMSTAECKVGYPDAADVEICVKTGKTLGSICMGDSGGPLVLEESGVIIGVAAFLPHKNCETEQPAIYMRVTSYLSWIIGVIGEINL